MENEGPGSYLNFFYKRNFLLARRMAKKNVFIKKLDVIDELGATTVIATDKTGTLTQNMMILTEMWYNQKYFSSKQT